MSHIGGLMIGIDVDIQRTDGRIHTAVVSAINRETESVTVEWFEKGEAKGKELEFDVIFQLNPLLAPINWTKNFRKQLSLESQDEKIEVECEKPSDETVIAIPPKIQYVMPLKSPAAKPKVYKETNQKSVTPNESPKIKREPISSSLPVKISTIQYVPPAETENQTDDPEMIADEEDKSVSSARPKDNGIQEKLTTPMKSAEIAISDNEISESKSKNNNSLLKVYSDSTPNLLSPPKQRRQFDSSLSVASSAPSSKPPTIIEPNNNENTFPEIRQSKARRSIARSQRRNSCLQEIEKIQQRRDDRRAAAASKVNRTRDDIDLNHPSFEFYRMIREYQESLDIRTLTLADTIEEHRICVCVRKRPLNKKELAKQIIDVVTVPSKESVIIHEPKVKVDLTKYVEHLTFRYDYAFDESNDNSLIYKFTAQPLVESIFDGGMATCFAYGQTGSGKTHTMGGDFTGKSQDCTKGIYALAAADVFRLKDEKYSDQELYIEVSYFEIYSGKVFDLLNEKKKLRVLEDAKGQVQIVGLKCEAVTCMQDVLDLLQLGSYIRTSGQTSANQQSSRSHAVFQLIIKKGKFRKLGGKFSLIDLAGNERGADTNSADRITRMEGAEINKSLLALKECIRALGRRGAHLPFRGSKLTQVLRDSFMGDRSRTCMIAMISPGHLCCEHSLNTLRYADRVKELNPSDPTTNSTASIGSSVSSSDMNVDSISPQPAPSSQPLQIVTPPSADNISTSSSSYSVSTQCSPSVSRIFPPNGRTPLQQIKEQKELADYKLLHSLNKEEETISPVVASFHEVIDHIEAMEEEVSEQHKSVIELMPVWLRRLKTLHKMSNRPEYDVDEYSIKLNEILEEQVQALNDLKEKVGEWRKELKNEEEISHQLYTNGNKS